MTCNTWATEAYKHATECYPEECCGLVLDIDGTHTLTCATAALVYDAGEITVNNITQTQHTHVEVPGTGGASSPNPATAETQPPTSGT